MAIKRDTEILRTSPQAEQISTDRCVWRSTIHDGMKRFETHRGSKRGTRSHRRRSDAHRQQDNVKRCPCHVGRHDCLSRIGLISRKRHHYRYHSHSLHLAPVCGRLATDIHPYKQMKYGILTGQQLYSRFKKKSYSAVIAKTTSTSS